MIDYKPIAESNNFIVLEKYTKHLVSKEVATVYQTEATLEKELIENLVNQGYEHLHHVTSPVTMLDNVRVQLQILNNVLFSDAEWIIFCEEYLDKPGDNPIDKTRKMHTDYIYDFVFDDGHIENIYLVDKKI